MAYGCLLKRNVRRTELLGELIEEMKVAAYIISCLIAGVVGAIVRVIYMFFPGMNVLDILVFGALAAGLAYLRPSRWWVWVILSIAPVMLFIAMTLFNLGSDSLREGVGVGHLLSALLIPIAATVGGWVAARRRIARELEADAAAGV